MGFMVADIICHLYGLENIELKYIRGDPNTERTIILMMNINRLIRLVYDAFKPDDYIVISDHGCEGPGIHNSHGVFAHTAGVDCPRGDFKNYDFANEILKYYEINQLIKTTEKPTDFDEVEAEKTIRKSLKKLGYFG